MRLGIREVLDALGAENPIAGAVAARKKEVDGELSEELQFHLEREAAKNEKAGMSKEEAQRAAGEYLS